MVAASDVDQIHRAVIAFARSIRNQRWDVYDGLSFVSYTLLEFVAQADCPHATDLADTYGLDKSTVSRQLADLESRGLLTRTVDYVHPRRRRLELTTEGERRLRCTRTAQRTAIAQELDSWDISHVSIFAELFSRFTAAPSPPTARLIEQLPPTPKRTCNPFAQSTQRS